MVTRVVPIEGGQPMRRTGLRDFFFLIFFVLEVGVIVLYGLFTEYGDSADPKATSNTAHVTEYYNAFIDVTIMVFIGFGFLMTFLKKYSWSAVGLTYLVAAFGVQVAILLVGFWHRVFGDPWDKISIDLTSLIGGDFGAATVLISMGAILGRSTPTQLLVMTIIELFAYTLNEAILIKEIEVADVGGSAVIHTFGAFFGLGVAWALGPRNPPQDNNGSVYHSDLFAMIGTVFLFIYWPSFNSALAGDTGNARARTQINTLLSLTGSVIATFLMSRVLRGGRFNMVDVQNATLAGGVAIGASANALVMPWGALTIGFVAGLISVFGFARIQGFLAAKLGLYDTCGVANLHGIPGVYAMLVSALVAAVASESDYSLAGLTAVFPARDERSAGEQAGYQVLALAVTLGISIVGGVITGFLLRLPLFDDQQELYSDVEYWDMEEGGEED